MVVLGYATNAAEAATNAATTAVENAMNIAINTTAAYCVDNTSQVKKFHRHFCEIF